MTEQLKAMLKEHWGVEGTITPTSARSFNDNFVVGGERKYMLKRYCTNRKKNVEVEHEVLRRISGLRVPRPVANKHNSTLVSFGGNAYALYEFIEGNTKWPVENSEAESAGRVLAEYHENTTGELERLHPPIYDLSSSKETIDSLDVPETIKSGYGRHIQAITSEIEPVYGRLPKGIVHGDYGSHNIFFEDGEVSAVLDWEWARNEALVFDVGGAMLRFASAGNGEFVPAGAVAFLKGYEAVRQLEKEETRLLMQMPKVNAVYVGAWYGRRGSLEGMRQRLWLMDWVDEHGGEFMGKVL